MTMAFRHFEVASHAAVYNKFRPSPPEQLIIKIIDFIKEKYSGPLEKAIDVGCGAGQSTKVLSPYFKEIIGFDPSSSQVNEASRQNILSNVKYLVGYAEKIDVEDCCLQLVTASQSCQWFNMAKFYSEVNRVLVPGGVLAMYGYLLPRPQYGDIRQELCDLVDKYYSITLGDYLFPANLKLLNKYMGEDFNKAPFPMIRDDAFLTQSHVSLADLIGYISSWSVFQNFMKKEGEQKSQDILQAFESEFKDTIGMKGLPAQDIRVLIQHEYFLILGSKPVS